MFAEFQTFEHYNAFLLIISSQISYLNKRAPDSVIAFPWTFMRLNHLLDEREGKKVVTLSSCSFNNNNTHSAGAKLFFLFFTIEYCVRIFIIVRGT